MSSAQIMSLSFGRKKQFLFRGRLRCTSMLQYTRVSTPAHLVAFDPSRCMVSGDRPRFIGRRAWLFVIVRGHYLRTSEIRMTERIDSSELDGLISSNDPVNIGHRHRDLNEALQVVDPLACVPRCGTQFRAGRDYNDV